MQKQIAAVKQHVAFVKTKQHIQDHKNIYLAAGGGLVVGALLRGASPELKQTIGSFNYKSTSNNIVTTTLERRGHPGFKILNNITGEPAASIRRMAEMDGKSRTFIVNHLQGENPLYTILGEMS